MHPPQRIALHRRLLHPSSLRLDRPSFVLFASSRARAPSLDALPNHLLCVLFPASSLVVDVREPGAAKFDQGVFDRGSPSREPSLDVVVVVARVVAFFDCPGGGEFDRLRRRLAQFLAKRADVPLVRRSRLASARVAHGDARRRRRTSGDECGTVGWRVGGVWICVWANSEKWRHGDRDVTTPRARRRALDAGARGRPRSGRGGKIL